MEQKSKKERLIVMPMISIIMPVYNAEKTVGRLVESIINQSFTDWELIAVDDGSTDGSGRILDGFARKDSRIRVIHKPNGGVASARQVGIDNAQGVYTIHADSDDWVEPDMLKEMYECALTNDSDIVIADFFTDSCNGSNLSVQNPGDCSTSSVLEGLYSKKLFGGLCHKLILKSVYENVIIRFEPEINYCEDLLILTKMLLWCNPKITYLPKAYYHYQLNDFSLTRQVSMDGYESMKRFHREVSKCLSCNERYAKFTNSFPVNEFIVFFTNNLYSSISRLQAEYSKVKPLMKDRFGMRWRVGFWCIEHGLINLAHRLIKF